MDRRLIARCGAYCGDCEWKEKTGCPGCQEAQGTMFWGKGERLANLKAWARGEDAYIKLGTFASRDGE